jgi:hypothetical protein
MDEKFNVNGIVQHVSAIDDEVSPTRHTYNWYIPPTSVVFRQAVIQWHTLCKAGLHP